MTISSLNSNPTAEDIAIEAQAIGALLFGYPRVSPQILAIADERDYTVGAHRTILEAARRLGDEGRHTDMPAVAEELERAGHLEHVGGAKKLSDLICEASFAANGPHYAAQVAERARRRRVAHAASQLAAKALDRSVTLDGQIAESIDSILAARKDGASGLIRASDLAEQILDDKAQIVRSRSTGWRNLDRLYKPADGRMTILSGNPGDGKSAFLDALLTNLGCVDHNARYAFWAPESAPTAEHARQLITIAAKRPWAAMSAPERRAALGWVDQTFVWVDHEVHDTIAAILAQVAAAHDRQPLAGFVIDPWTELDATRDARQREDEWISPQITRVRKFARDHGLHAWVVVHPKNLDKRNDGTYPVPSSSDLHGGSVWKKKADVLICVWRDAAGITRPATTVDIHVQKIRKKWDGQIGRTELRFDVETGCYYPIAQVAEAM